MLLAAPVPSAATNAGEVHSVIDTSERFEEFERRLSSIEEALAEAGLGERPGPNRKGDDGFSGTGSVRGRGVRGGRDGEGVQGAQGVQGVQGGQGVQGVRGGRDGQGVRGDAASVEADYVHPGDYVLRPQGSSGTVEETPLLRHNQLGEPYSIKLVYPGFYLGIKIGDATCTVGFPAIKERLAKRVQPGHLFFIYVTSPERRIIGMAQASEPAQYMPELDQKRPWSLTLAWVIGPKSQGVRFTDIGLQVKARVGDSTYSITDDVAAAIIGCLQDMDDLSEDELRKAKERYRMFA